MTSTGAPPATPSVDVLLRDGSVAQVRLLVPDDEPALRALNERVTLRTRMLRYFSLSERSGDWYVERVLACARLCDALVAVVDDTVVAIGSFSRQERDPHVAEVALLVDDDHQSLGIGALLLEQLGALALDHGITTLLADVLVDNAPMLRLLADSGFEVGEVSTGSGVTELRIELADSDRLQRAVHRREVHAERASLEHVLAPRSVALVGSTRPGSVTDHVHEALAGAHHAPFTGEVHRVHGPGALRKVSAPVDLVIVTVPAESVLEVAADAAAIGAKGLLVLSAGFAEEGEAGARRQRALLRLCRRSGMRLIGPNCLGIVNTDPAVRLNATFCDADARPGPVALVSQSGAVGAAALRHAERRGTGLSLFVSTGNKADVSGNDLLCYLEADPRTAVIALYLESFGNPQRFARLADVIGRTKPIAVLKAGRTPVGQRAGASHTAAAATPDVAVRAMLTSAGVVVADDLPELFDLLTLLESPRLPRGPRLAVVGNSGGPGVLAADACAAAGIQLAELSPGTLDGLAALRGRPVGNPVDLLGTMPPETLEGAVDLLLADPSVDCVLSICTGLRRDHEHRLAEALSRAQLRHSDVPVIATFPGSAWPPPDLQTAGIPWFEFPEQAVAALGKVVRYAEWRARPRPAGPQSDARSRRQAQAVLTARAADGWLSPAETGALLAAYGIPFAPGIEVADPDEACVAAEALGYPVALKAVGKDIVHKSDVGGVALHLRTPGDLRRAATGMRARLGDRMDHALVQPMREDHPSLELLVGLTVDDDIGPLVLVGAGGVLTELLDDRVVRMPTADRSLAAEQLAGLRCAPLFAGYRNQRPLDREAVVDVLLALGRIAHDLPEVRELDLNPLLVTAAGVSCLDARVRVQTPAEWPHPDTRRLD